MLLSSALSAVLALTGSAQMHDTIGPVRDAFTSCLRQYVDHSLQDRKAVDAFNTELAQQCTQQEQAYRAAMIRRDTSARIRQADAEQSANEEIDWARQNARETFADSQPQ